MSTDHLKKPKTQVAMRRIGHIMANQIAPTFQAGALVTVIVRFPGEPECDFFMSDRAETIPELRAFLDRCEKRDELDHTTAGVAVPAPCAETYAGCAPDCHANNRCTAGVSATDSHTFPGIPASSALDSGASTVSPVGEDQWTDEQDQSGVQG